MFQTVHHIKNGAQEMYEIDARAAVAKHPNEWSKEAWTDEAKAAAAKAERKAAKADTDKPAAPVEPTASEPAKSDPDSTGLAKVADEAKAAAKPGIGING